MKGEIRLAVQVPGIRVTDAPPVTTQVSGVSTSIASFFGHAPWGPIGVSILCNSWEEYKRIFGGLCADYLLGYSVREFFNNGGSLARITRVVHYTDVTDKTTKTSTASSIPLLDALGAHSVTLNAKYDGVKGDNIKISIEDSTSTDYSLFVKYNGIIVERFIGVTQSNISSMLEESDYLGTPSDIASDITPVNIADAPLTGGDDGTTSIAEADFVGDSGEATGFYSLDNYEVDLLSIPDMCSSTLFNSALTYAESRGDMFVVVDVPIETEPAEVGAYMFSLLSSECGAVYYPHVRITDPLASGVSKTKLIPPSGFVCGVYARNDNLRGIWKAPAGVEAYLVDSIGLEYDIDDKKQSTLNPIGVNCLRVDGSVVIWGSELADINSPYANVNGKRFQLYLKKTFKKNYRWVVFEPIDEKILGPTGRIEVSANAWFDALDKDSRGGPFDHEAEVVYSIKADFENNPKFARDSGRVQIDVSYRQKGVAKDVNFSVGLSK